MSNTNADGPSHDKQAIKVFLMHLAGELRFQEIALSGNPVPTNLQKAISQLRFKFGGGLLPDAEKLSYSTGAPFEEGLDGYTTRQALVNRRRDQFKQVLAVITLLGEREI